MPSRRVLVLKSTKSSPPFSVVSFVTSRKVFEEMSESSGVKNPSYSLEDNLTLAPAADISQVEQGEAKQSKPSVRDNVLAFCVVFCQLVQVSELCFYQVQLRAFTGIQSTAKQRDRPYHTAQDS